jgi:hypothetical protein
MVQSGQEKQLDSVHYLSFPSGDAAVAFAVATVIISFVTWPLACLLLAASIGVALLRVTAMAHYPSDVLVGAAIGICAGWLSVQIERRRLLLVQPWFNLNHDIAILGIIAIPILLGLFEGFDKLAMFLKTYGLLVVCILLTIGARRLLKRHGDVSAGLYHSDRKATWRKMFLRKSAAKQ